MKGISRITQTLVAAGAASLGLASHASPGLAPPEADAWWPQWQARLSVMGTPGAASLLAGPRDGSPGGLALQSSRPALALLGDYTFARPAIGQFRASGGLLWGALGAPLAGAAVPLGAAGAASPGTWVGWGSSVQGWSAPHGASALDTAETVPYVGLGYSGTLWRDSLSLSADLGLVSERPAAAANVSRALFGNQGMSQALRDMRVSPLLQLGMRYRF